MIALRLAWRGLRGAPWRSLTLLAAIASSLAILLAIEAAREGFLRRAQDSSGAWLGADLVLLAREPVQELSGFPVILETIVVVSGHALHLKVTPAAVSGAILGPDTAAQLRLQPGQRFPFGSTELVYHQTLNDEPDRFIGLPSGLPRLLVSQAHWEASGLGLQAPAPLYRYLFHEAGPPALAQRKSELLRLYPGALVLSKEDGYDDAEATISQTIFYTRTVGAFAFLMGFSAVFLLLRLSLLEDLDQIALLHILGARFVQSRAVTLFKTALVLTASLPIAFPLARLLMEFIHRRLAYFSPYSSLGFPLSPSLASALVLAVALLFLGASRLHARLRHLRPAAILRRDVSGLSRFHTASILLFAFLVCAATTPVWLTHRALVPALSGSSLPGGDGLLVLGKLDPEITDLPPPTRRLDTVWVRVLQNSSPRLMALASCEPSLEGAILNQAFARRLALSPGSSLALALGRRTATLPVQSLRRASGLDAFLSQIVLPCELLQGLPPIHLAWFSGDPAHLRRSLPSVTPSLTRAEWQSRLADLTDRAATLFWLFLGYFVSMALLLTFLLLRLLLHSRKDEIALWRTLGASSLLVWRRLALAWFPRLAALSSLGVALGWAIASFVVTQLNGPILLWTPWLFAAPLLYLSLWLVLFSLALRPLLARRPMQLFRRLH